MTTKKPTAFEQAIEASGQWARRERSARDITDHLDAIRAIVLELGKASERGNQAATHALEDAERMRLQLAEVWRLLDSIVCPFCRAGEAKTHAPKCPMQEVRRCRY